MCWSIEGVVGVGFQLNFFVSVVVEGLGKRGGCSGRGGFVVRVVVVDAKLVVWLARVWFGIRSSDEVGEGVSVLAVADVLPELKLAAANGSVSELRRLERTLHDAIGRLDGHLSGAHEAARQKELAHNASEARRSRR